MERSSAEFACFVHSPADVDSMPSRPSTIGLAFATIRVASIAVVLGGVVIGGLAWWTLDRESRLRAEIADLETRMAAEVAARDAAIERLGRDRRLARIEVLDRIEGTEGEDPRTALRFIELDDEGRELARRDLEIPGEIVHIDGWTARFPAGKVASGDDPLRERTLVLLRRVYSDSMAPRDGIPLDTPGAIPDGYAGSEAVRFQQAIWKRFWTLATDPDAARAAGLRVAQGESVYKPMRPGDVFELRVEAVGGMTLVPLDRQVNAPSTVEE